MKKYAYLSYNKLSKQYEGLMSFASDELAIYRLKNQIDLNEYEICRVGYFDIESGVLTPEAPVRLAFTTVDGMCKKVED